MRLSYPCWFSVLWLWLLVLAALGTAPAQATPVVAKALVLGPAPDWVDTLPLPTAVSSTHDNDPAVLLFDRQLRVQAGKVARYTRLVRQVRSQADIAQFGQFTADFDPTHDSLSLHTLRVHRGGQIRDALDPSRLEVLRREARLEYQVYDGTHTAHLLIEDVRVGDLIEEGYTLVQTNPGLGGHFVTSERVGFSFFIGRQRLVVWYAGQAPLAVRVLGSQQAAQAERHGEFMRYQWEARDVAAIPGDASSPGWYWTWPVVQFSDFADWRSVALWASDHFRHADHPDPDVVALAAAIAATETTQDERALAALRFVQDEVRYTAIEIGAGAFAPAGPGVTLRRRFGDCKDKALLLVAILRQWGIDARPALVNSRRRRAVAEMLPSAIAFDHAIVCVGSGTDRLWLDPTAADQGGQLDSRAVEDYGFALVVDPQSAGLEPMTPPSIGDDHTVDVLYRFAVGAVGSSTGLELRTTYYGEAADRVRAGQRGAARSDIERNSLNYYARTYPGIRQTAPMQVDDDRRDNALAITEHFAIDRHWVLSADGKRNVCELSAPEIDEFLVAPDQPVRTAPLALRKPVHVRAVLAVTVEGEYPMVGESKAVAHPAFEHRYESSPRPNGVDVVLTYRALADAVSPSDVPAFVDKLREARNSSAYQFYRNVDSGKASAATQDAGDINWLMVAITLVILMVLGVAAAVAWRFAVALPPVEVFEPIGAIGGWLLLPAFSLVLGPVMRVVTLKDAGWLFRAADWTAAVAEPSQRKLAWAGVFVLTSELTLLAMTLFAGALFSARRRAAPAAMIVLLLGQSLYVFVDSQFAQALNLGDGSPLDSSGAARTVITALIWVAYFVRSDRVRRTFVR